MYTIVDGSLGMQWAMGQHWETESLSRIDMMRSMNLLRCLEVKCCCHSRWVALAVLALAKFLCLWDTSWLDCSLSDVQNCLFIMCH